MTSRAWKRGPPRREPRNRAPEKGNPARWTPAGKFRPPALARPLPIWTPAKSIPAAIFDRSGSPLKRRHAPPPYWQRHAKGAERVDTGRFVPMPTPASRPDGPMSNHELYEYYKRMGMLEYFFTYICPGG